MTSRPPLKPTLLQRRVCFCIEMFFGSCPIIAGAILCGAGLFYGLSGIFPLWFASVAAVLFGCIVFVLVWALVLIGVGHIFINEWRNL